MKKVLKNILNRLDLDIRRPSRVRIPFGVDWFHDIEYFLKADRLGTVLDIGANIGTVTKRLTEFFPDSDIFSFEPVPSTYEKLIQNTRNLKRVTVIQAGMFNHVGEGEITAKPHSPQNTLLFDERVKNSHHGMTTASVPLLTVDKFCNNHGIDHIGLLKTDTEGSDLQVLQGAETRLRSGWVDFILTECAFPGVGEDLAHSSFDTIHKFVISFGYHVVSFYTGGVNELGWIWGDVLFRRVIGLNPGRVAVLQTYRRKLWTEG
jgi:FkbM family methyltransferase